MAKKIQAYIKLQVKAGQANPSPPVGPALGQHGINIMAFCKDYNARTAHMAGSIISSLERNETMISLSIGVDINTTSRNRRRPD